MTATGLRPQRTEPFYKNEETPLQNLLQEAELTSYYSLLTNKLKVSVLWHFIPYHEGYSKKGLLIVSVVVVYCSAILSVFTFAFYWPNVLVIFKVRNVEHLKFVTEDDLSGIGMTKPEQRRLQKCFSKLYPDSYLGKLKKVRIGSVVLSYHISLLIELQKAKFFLEIR